MKRRKGLFHYTQLLVAYTVLLLFIVSSIAVQPLFALYETDATILPSNGSVLVAAYKAAVIDTTPAATSTNKLYVLGAVDIIQLYNSGTAPVDMATVRIVDSANPTRELLFNKNERTGWLEPGKHVVLAAPNTVNGATFTLDGWASSPPALVAAKTAGLSVLYGGYRANSIDVTGNNILRKRTFGSASYNVTFLDAVASSDVSDSTATNRLFDDGLYMPTANPTGLSIIEIYPYSSSCSPFDNSILCGDYIKITNTSQQDIELDELVLRTDSSSSGRTAANTFHLSGTLLPGKTYLIDRTDAGAMISLTNSGGYVWLEDTWGMQHYAATTQQYASAGSSLQGFSYALADDGAWKWTSTPRPTGDNLITIPVTESVPCADGKYRSPETNRCRNIEEVIGDLVQCQDGYERNSLTNRCRKIGTSSGAELTPCKEGQERNAATNRCRSIASALAELLPCDEGYERNPATNRCRKAKDLSVLGAADYPVEPYGQDSTSLATWWVVGGIAALAAGYGVWEWRREISTGLGRIRIAFTSRK